MAVRSGPSPRNGFVVIRPDATAELQMVEREVTVFFTVAVDPTRSPRTKRSASPRVMVAMGLSPIHLDEEAL